MNAVSLGQHGAYSGRFMTRPPYINMRRSTLLALLLSASVDALSNPHQRARNAIPERPRSQQLNQRKALQTRQTSSYLTNKTSSTLDVSTINREVIGWQLAEFAVDGTKIPNVDFDAGESYAGLLPNGPSGNSSLWFWFWPSSNPDASDEITLWLNGGPGCR